MKVFFHEGQRAHYPKSFLVRGAQRPNPERPERVDRLLTGLHGEGHDILTPEPHGLSPVAAVHTPDYLHFLETAYNRWQAIEGTGPEVIPNVHPDRRGGSYPRVIAGQAGYHQADTACPIGAETWGAARHSADTAVSATKAVLAGAPAAYALCRPPGHHAFADMAGGFCYLNNAAIAAELLRGAQDRVAIVDVDLHHGNGTQGIFYRRRDVLTVSIHADPADFYPFFWGHAAERGEAEGLGYNLNLPLPLGSGDEAFLAALDEALLRVQAFQPGALVAALGLDAYEGDPFGGLAVSTEGFAAIAKRIAKLKLPTVLVQEGGYLCDALGANLAAALRGFETG